MRLPASSTVRNKSELLTLSQVFCHSSTKHVKTYGFPRHLEKPNTAWWPASSNPSNLRHKICLPGATHMQDFASASSPAGQSMPLQQPQFHPHLLPPSFPPLWLYHASPPWNGVNCPWRTDLLPLGVQCPLPSQRVWHKLGQSDCPLWNLTCECSIRIYNSRTIGADLFQRPC